MTTPTICSRPIILASSSPRRRELLAGLGIKFLIDPSHIPEPPLNPAEAPARYVMRMARAKAREVARRHPEGLILGADTIVVSGGISLGKPASDEEAGRMLRRLRGRWHEVYTGICLIDNITGRAGAASCRSRVHMRRLAPEEIDWYLSTREHRDKAGAYAIQGYASIFVDRIEGCYFNIVGFPIVTFARLCRRLKLAQLPNASG
jgi:septum formation protein